ncbi:hypothetical protein [Blattabacterium cuenoti]|uniref:hypothetical protein n=1 Tax=Blattabacterium cuenoti TaxID=1653831 RepID=UPI00163B9230
MINIITELFIYHQFFKKKLFLIKKKEIYKKYNITEYKLILNYFYYLKKIDNHIDLLKKIKNNLKKLEAQSGIEPL